MDKLIIEISPKEFEDLMLELGLLAATFEYKHNDFESAIKARAVRRKLDNLAVYRYIYEDKQ